MRKLLTFFVALFITSSLFAGGIVTNVNQSASWIRLPSRNASTNIDAVYYNPAGLMKLENGFHVSLSNQFISQTREVDNNYSGPPSTVVPLAAGVDHYGLNQYAYKGTAKAPLFPSLFAVYKMDKIAFSFGFGVVGGGGAATYKEGLPSFAMGPSDLVPALASKAGVKGYKLNAYFEGTSAFFGYQAGISYKINDWLSVAGGFRYVTAKNTYKGHLTDIQLNMGTQASPTWLAASSVLGGLSANLTSIKGIPTSLAPAISGGLGGQNLTVAAGLSPAIAAAKPSIEAALAALGVPAATIAVMPLSTISATVTGATPALNDQIASLTASASLVADQAADVEQTGSGYAGIFSVNISPSENLNIAVKFETQTKIKLKNNTAQDLTVGYAAKAGNVPGALVPDMTQPITMFLDGDITRNDMPALLSLGIDYKLSPNLKLSLGGNYYFDKMADFGHKTDDDLNGATPIVHIPNKDIIGTNGASIQGGLEYNISQKFLVSGGFILSNRGVNEKFQSDLNYYQASKTFGVGGAYNITNKIQLNLGVSTTLYTDATKTTDHMFTGYATPIKSTETYKKNTIMGGIGLDFRF
jgi:long-chain fatty acid transport protein